MKKKLHILLISGLLLLLPAGLSAQDFKGEPGVNQILKKHASDLEPFTFLLIKDGSPVYNEHFVGNFSEANKVDANTKIKVASASKWLVAATVLTLVDDGKLSLDDPVSAYLPKFNGDKGKMTVRQLLSHTSGLPANSVYIKDKNLSLAESVDNIAETINLTAQPGAELNYGGVSFQVVARVAEVASGEDWETLFSDAIGGPCQMFHTDYGKTKYKDIGDGAYSTAADYGNFLVMLLNKGVYNDKRVLSERMINEMMTNQVGNVPIGYTPYKLKSAQNSNHYGLGVWIDKEGDLNNIGTEVSSQGGRGFTPWINTCKGIAGIFSTYGSVTEIQPAIDAAKDIVDQEFVSNCAEHKTTMGQTKNDQLIIKRNAPGASYTNISFNLIKDSYVSLKIFDPLGNPVKEILDGKLMKGDYNFPIDASELKDGIYFYKLKVDGKTETKKLTISSN